MQENVYARGGIAPQCAEAARFKTERYTLKIPPQNLLIGKVTKCSYALRRRCLDRVR